MNYPPYVDTSLFHRNPTVVKVIMTTLRSTGLGRDGSDPVRGLCEIYTLDGTLICSIDPWEPTEA